MAHNNRLTILRLLILYLATVISACSNSKQGFETIPFEKNVQITIAEKGTIRVIMKEIVNSNQGTLVKSNLEVSLIDGKINYVNPICLQLFVGEYALKEPFQVSSMFHIININILAKDLPSVDQYWDVSDVLKFDEMHDEPSIDFTIKAQPNCRVFSYDMGSAFLHDVDTR